MYPPTTLYKQINNQTSLNPKYNPKYKLRSGNTKMPLRKTRKITNKKEEIETSY